MAKLLVKFDRDWGDEFNVYGFAVYDKERWEKDFQKFRDAKGWNGFWFGTNEGWDNDFYLISDFIEGYTVTEISEQEAEVLDKLFRKYSDNIDFGIFPHPSDLVDSDEDFED